MGNVCLNCGEKVKKGRKYCCGHCAGSYKHLCSIREKAGLDNIYEALYYVIDPKEVSKFKTFMEKILLEQQLFRKELYTLEKRATEQDILWENLVGDLEEEEISSSHIRWWKDKLVSKHNLDNKSRMIGWLLNVADVLDTYSQAKSSKRA